MPLIDAIHAREILDSRGNPTVEVDVILDNNISGRASVPSGASTGKAEAVELRDHDMQRFKGLGVMHAVAFVEGEIADALVGESIEEQAFIDKTLVALDGTPNKSRLGANAVLGVSLACVKAAAENAGLPLFQYFGGIQARTMPVPLMNILNGGAHADNALDIQECMIMPCTARSFKHALQMGAEVFYTLKTILQSKNYSINVGDEGGFAPQVAGTQDALDLIMYAIEKAGYVPGQDIMLALDAASSEFYKEGHYLIDQQKKDAGELVDYYETLCKNYPIFSIEDGMAETDEDGWGCLTQRLGEHIQLVGDDLFVTNPAILKRGIDKKHANALLVKPNQIGTLTETWEAMDVAKKAGYRSIISHRSGETEDTIIAHIAVGSNAGQIKTGSLSRTDRVAKYNELLRIEEILSDNAVYASYIFG